MSRTRRSSEREPAVSLTVKHERHRWLAPVADFVVVVPYRNKVSLQAQKDFIDEGILIVTTDNLIPALKRLGA